MQIERLQVSNHERWGNLVKTWATGVNYLGDENSYPVPQTMDEFKEQLAKAQVFATVPERFKNIKFVSSEQDTIVVKLPPKAMVHPGAGRPDIAEFPEQKMNIVNHAGLGRITEQ